MRAVNYDVRADDPCSGCCSFPTLKISFRHQAIWPPKPDTSIAFKYNTVYPTPLDKFHFFKINRFRFFVQDIHLQRADGSVAQVSDTLGMTGATGVSFTVEDNFAVLDRDLIQSVALGTLITEGEFSQVQLRIGLEEAVRSSLPNDTPTGHVLTTTDTLLYDTLSGFRNGLLRFYRDTLDSSPIEEIVFENSELLSLLLPEPLMVLPGHHLKLTITVNYLALFAGISIQDDPIAAIRQKIAENLSAAVEITEAKLE